MYLCLFVPVSELEPLVNNIMVNDDGHAEKIVQNGYRNDYKRNYRPLSQSKGRSVERETTEQETLIGQKENGPNRAIYKKPNASWYKEVIELRKKAGEYKQRGWGTELVPEHISELYNKQLDVWDQVSRRSSLSALSLASTVHKYVHSLEQRNAGVQVINTITFVLQGLHQGRKRRGKQQTQLAHEISC